MHHPETPLNPCRHHRLHTPLFTLGMVAAALLLARCDGDSPLESTPELTISMETQDNKVLAGGQTSLSWNRELSDFSLAYFDPFKSQEATLGWEELVPQSVGNTDAEIDVPAMYYDTLKVRLIDNESQDTAYTQATLRYFIFTTAPRTDTTYSVGDTVHFAWRISPEISQAILLLAVDGGRERGYITGFSSITYPDTTYTWVIGGENESGLTYPAQNCRAVVAGYENQDYFDESLAQFDIVETN